MFVPRQGHRQNDQDNQQHGRLQTLHIALSRDSTGHKRQSTGRRKTKASANPKKPFRKSRAKRSTYIAAPPPAIDDTSPMPGVCRCFGSSLAATTMAPGNSGPAKNRISETATAAPARRQARGNQGDEVDGDDQPFSWIR